MCIQCYEDDKLDSVDVLEDRPVQCFVGTHSTEKNLEIIPSKYVLSDMNFDDNLKYYLFKGLEDIVSKNWIDTIWKMLYERGKMYESICNKR